MTIRALSAALLLVGMVWLSIALDPGPSLVTTQRLPHDVATLTSTTWSAFLEAFPGKNACLTDVGLRLVEDVPDGAARYLAADALIEIQVPTSPFRYQESLAHELGHHLEVRCSAESEIGVDFRRSQGFSPADGWDHAERWQDRPMEHFAEAVVVRVLGSQHTHGDVIHVSDASVEILERWALTISSSG